MFFRASRWSDALLLYQEAEALCCSHDAAAQTARGAQAQEARSRAAFALLQEAARIRAGTGAGAAAGWKWRHTSLRTPPRGPA